MDNLLRETRDVIKNQSSQLGSEFGIEEVIPPARLEYTLPTTVPTTPDGLSNIMIATRHEILHDTSMVFPPFA